VNSAGDAYLSPARNIATVEPSEDAAGHVNDNEEIADGKSGARESRYW
jgi:hypothetical protein